MTAHRERYAVYEGVPEVVAVPTGLPTTEGLLAVLVLVLDKSVSCSEMEDFVTRYRFVPRQETARAADSQARWSLEPDGRVTFTFLCAEGASRIVLPADPRIHQWTALARLGGGSISVMVVPGLPSTDMPVIARRLTPGGGEYWHLSVGCLPA
jgi:hypothetical protein